LIQQYVIHKIHWQDKKKQYKVSVTLSNFFHVFIILIWYDYWIKIDIKAIVIVLLSQKNLYKSIIF